MTSEKKEGRHPISISEARLILQTHLEGKYQEYHKYNINKEKTIPGKKILMKTREYLERVGKIDSKASADELRLTLEELGLTNDEVSLAASLFPVTAEQARQLIPSLSRLSEDVVQSVVEKTQLFYYKY